MARRKDRLIEELREIRRKISERLWEAERREGTCIYEIRRMGRNALRRMRREIGAAPANSRLKKKSRSR